jgi:hypothetical protein
MVTPHVHPRDPGQKLSSLIHLDAFAALDDGAVHPPSPPRLDWSLMFAAGISNHARSQFALTVQQYRSGLATTEM